MAETYRIADLNIQIDSMYGTIHSQCKVYRSCGAPDLIIRMTTDDIDREREKSIRGHLKSECQFFTYGNDYLETLAIYRKIAEKMPDYDTFLFHGSAIAVDGEAYIFIAKSGTGKSTHTRLWREMLGGKAIMINDDKPLIRVHEDGTATAYGTPWDGKHHLSNNISVPVRAICVLERAAENHIMRITKTEALPMLVQQTYRPADPDMLDKTLTLLDRMDVSLYRLGCNMDMSAAELSYHAMKEELL